MADDEDLLSRANSLINADSGAGRGERPSRPAPNAPTAQLPGLDDSDRRDAGHARPPTAKTMTCRC
jgi:hypothetical protein